MIIPKDISKTVWDTFAILCFIIVIIVGLWGVRLKRKLKRSEDLRVEELEKELEEGDKL
jgi:hypothetical protein